MPSENRPSSPQNAPDPASSYERAKPEKEAGMGRMENNKAVPEASPDRSSDAVTNSHRPRQINAEAQDVSKDPEQMDPEDRAVRPRMANADRMSPPSEVDHSMKDEEPLGWDQAPTGKTDDQQKRHPRTEGKGGTK